MADEDEPPGCWPPARSASWSSRQRGTPPISSRTKSSRYRTFVVSSARDANVLSEPTKPQPEPAVVDWLRQNEPEIVVDPVILGEIRLGILLLPRGRRRRKLEAWFDEGVRRVHCLPWHATTGLRWAELLASLRASGRAMPIKHSVIASTALEHGLTVATRNRTDFEKAGVELLDPFSTSDT